MKRSVLFLLIVFIFCISNQSYAKIKEKKGIVHYHNGDKYVGEYRFNSVSKQTTFHGKGIMYYSSGATLDGIWMCGKIQQGTYAYPDGSIFEGKMSDNYWTGSITYAKSGKVKFGEVWHYAAGCKFVGTLNTFTQTPVTGAFSCEIVNNVGDKYIGQIESSKIKNGRMNYSNGDSFEGEFVANRPSKGKYYCANPVERKGWTIPEGCTFTGNISDFTGSVDVAIVKNGDEYIGNLTNGLPDQYGTMMYADGRVEDGFWHHGMSQVEYEAYCEAERLEKEAAELRVKQEQEAAELRAKQEQAMKDAQKAKERDERKQRLISKYGQRYGNALANGRLELGMTREMCKAVVDFPVYDVILNRVMNSTVETWMFNKEKQNQQFANAISELAPEEAAVAALFIGFADQMGGSPKYSVLTFTDGKLTSLY